MRPHRSGRVPVCSLNAARADVTVFIDRRTQTMSVSVDGTPYATWAVSTARRGYQTPSGSFRPFRLERVWYSKQYDDAPMPNSIFFAGGYAIHGTTETRRLGLPVSHGCVRLPAHARKLFELVRSRGLSQTRCSSVRAAGFVLCRATNFLIDQYQCRLRQGDGDNNLTSVLQ